MQPPGTLAATSRAARGTDGAFLGQQQQSATRPAGAPPPLTGQPQRFPKARRVRRRGEFSAVFESGTRLHGRFFTFLLLPNRLSSPRLGIVASRKLGGAVQRNRAKRLIREMFRKQLGVGGVMPALDMVVIPRRELFEATYEVLARDFRNIWRRVVERTAAVNG